MRSIRKNKHFISNHFDISDVYQSLNFIIRSETDGMIILCGKNIMITFNEDLVPYNSIRLDLNPKSGVLVGDNIYLCGDSEQTITYNFWSRGTVHKSNVAVYSRLTL